MIKTDVLVVGAGLAGLSTAYFLGQKSKGSVIIIEQETALGGHSSGRNAGMLRQALSDPLLVKLAKQSVTYFNGLDRRDWAGVKLVKSGSLLLSQDQGSAELARTQKALEANRVTFQRWDRRQAIGRVSILETTDFKEALFCPDDAMLDLTPLLTGFVKNLLRMHIPILTGRSVLHIKKDDAGFIVKTSKETFIAKKVVNAAGAWAAVVGQQAGAAKLPLMAYRRHLFLSPNSELLPPNFSKWPFVWDISRDFYFRPVQEGIMLSPCDKTLEKKGDRKERVNPVMKKALRTKMRDFSKAMRSWSVGRGRSGLRTMLPDGRFAVGEDARKKGFYWVAGLGGHGVTTCFAVGQLAATMVMGHKVDPQVQRALSPGRFR